MTGEREVLASELPPSDMEEAEVSEARSEVGEWADGVNPKSAKYGCNNARPAETRSSELNTNKF